MAPNDRGAAIEISNIRRNGKMGINGIGAAGYPVTGYQTRKAERSAESGATEFMEIVAEKAAQDKATDYDEKVFDMVGPNAPQNVKDAWMQRNRHCMI